MSRPGQSPAGPGDLHRFVRLGRDRHDAPLRRSATETTLDQPPAAIDELMDQLTAEQQAEIAAVYLLQELMARVTKGAYDTPEGEA